MTECDWLTGTDPNVILALLGETTSARKLRLFACAAARQLWKLFPDDRSRQAIEVSERFADGKATEAERRKVWADANAAQDEAAWYAMRPALAAAGTLLPDIDLAVSHVIHDVTRVLARQALLAAWGKQVKVKEFDRMREQAIFEANAALCELLREVFGNPFRLVKVDPAWLAANQNAVQHIATAIYEERRWDDLPILADALEDAGCDNEEMLRHCRQTRRHVPGCWVLDALLGQE